jgi:hypothetical protein
MKRFWLILPVIFLSACGTPPTAIIPSETPPPATELPLSTVTPVCKSTEPTDDDVDAALEYTADLFDPAEWEQSYEVFDDKVSVTWQNIPQSAVVFLEARIFSCGYEEPDLNKIFSDEYWDALFVNYEGYELISECRSNLGLRLYEFETASQGFDYHIRYWEENDTDNRIITTMIIFPFGSESTLDDYSTELFPGLPNCS